MKKFHVLSFLTVALLAILLVGCGKQSKNTIRIGASSIPHAQILKHVEPQLAKEGVHLKVTVFQDYIMPNEALAEKELDANYFQTTAFLDRWNANYGGHLISVGSVHLEPIGIYSKKVKKLQDLKPNSKILVSDNVPDYGRILDLFQKAGLITMKPGVNVANANFSDIEKNPRHLQFEDSYDPKLMTDIYKNNEGDAVAINSNYAVQAGLIPKRDSIALQKSDPNSPYNNIVAVRKSERNNQNIKKLMNALQSKSTQKWIKSKYKGAVLPSKDPD
ncbi:lipoprotein [Philodulcilactobacillus myokoensis]|uniref:Lipoprotein n=1 Tax=Philodulcilactobacillus myokoensis TaxID=2929573 RepID=A0A9W6B1D6_9LACO|nr:MetQ/NlpA family ABC transporter substrate-binding protein [Philodulcilactobacillus myokoensis]GLB47067.1 lipoprotein [Philodulcilactobacillus myokoensis]